MNKTLNAPRGPLRSLPTSRPVPGNAAARSFFCSERPQPLPPHAVLYETAVAGGRRMFRATDRAGAIYYFTPDQAVSLVPLRDGGCRINLRHGRWMMLSLPPDTVARRLWKSRAA